MKDIYRMTPRQFRVACDAGAFGDEKVELLAGIPFVMTKNPPHEFVVSRLAEALRPIVGPSGSIVREEKSAKLGTWRPIPDIAIVEGPDTRYQAVLPGPADISLIVEVADSDLQEGSGPKVPPLRRVRNPPLLDRQAEWSADRGPFGPGGPGQGGAISVVSHLRGGRSGPRPGLVLPRGSDPAPIAAGRTGDNIPMRSRMMTRDFRIACVLALGLTMLARDAFAQRRYPRGYGRYGWGGWGSVATDPAAGYMTGLGNYARGQGAYEVDDANAQAINNQTMIQWNQALRERQKELQEQKRRDDAKRKEERDARVAGMELADGTTLNNLLMQISDLDPAAVKSSRANASLSAGAIREIPFAWNTEAITACIDQMTGRDLLPDTLMGPQFSDERAALDDAVEQALKEDARGDVSSLTMRRVSAAIKAFQAKFVKVVPDTNSDYPECDAYLTTLASLTRLLHDPAMKKALAELDHFPNPTVGHLIAFMQSYNLRFGPATTDRQVRLYEALAAMLRKVADDVNAAPPRARPPARARTTSRPRPAMRSRG